MDCKRIQEYIITDYIDARMGDKQKGLIDQHLTHCQDCQNFLISIKKEVVEPFQSAQKFAPDGSLWAQIKQAIEEEQVQQIKNNFISDLWEKIKKAVHIPRPAFALATMATIIFIIGTTGQFFNNSQIVNINGQDQMEYISSLINDPVDVTGHNGNDPQTPIEKYFL